MSEIFFENLLLLYFHWFYRVSTIQTLLQAEHLSSSVGASYYSKTLWP